MLDTLLNDTEGGNSETSITSDNVKDIMTLYNLLPVTSRTGILPATRVRLNQALNKLSQYLVIIAKDLEPRTMAPKNKKTAVTMNGIADRR